MVHGPFGLFINLKTFVSVSLESLPTDSALSDSRVYVHLRSSVHEVNAVTANNRRKQAQDESTSDSSASVGTLKPTKMAIAVEGGCVCRLLLLLASPCELLQWQFHLLLRWQVLVLSDRSRDTRNVIGSLCVVDISCATIAGVCVAPGGSTFPTLATTVVSFAFSFLLPPLPPVLLTLRMLMLVRFPWFCYFASLTTVNTASSATVAAGLVQMVT